MKTVFLVLILVIIIVMSQAIAIQIETISKVLLWYNARNIATDSTCTIAATRRAVQGS